jgi:hypothetical protein
LIFLQLLVSFWDVFELRTNRLKLALSQHLLNFHSLRKAAPIWHATCIKTGQNQVANSEMGSEATRLATNQAVECMTDLDRSQVEARGSRSRAMLAKAEKQHRIPESGKEAKHAARTGARDT